MGRTLTKADIVERVWAATGMSRPRAAQCVEALLDLMKEALRREGRLLFSGLGLFDCRAKGPRRGRNPATGEDLMLPGRRVVVFRTSQKLRPLLVCPGNGTGGDAPDPQAGPEGDAA